MKRNKSYQYRSQKKKGKALPITLISLGIIVAGITSWIGMNDWNLEKSYKKIEQVIYQDDNKVDDETTEPVNPDENYDSENIDENNEVEVPKDEVPEVETPDVETPEKDNRQYIEGQELPKEPTYIEGILIANKQYPLPSTYSPGESDEARAAFHEMAAAAKLDGFELIAFSTYRSYDYQTGLYERYVERDGSEAADRYSARPGYSEHQTGLAFDIGEVDNEQYYASAKFGETDAGKWVAANAYRFGFIMRYPEGKEKRTGYMHESWHFRYVGIEIAREIYKQNISLEEYLGI
ncbi:D-alanyl-D-alanine carboxypeptidase family protein [Sporosarcina sp. Marseille-Q4063]|uniref:M15 family metallopeptidase n=1 Tax=Sporosarcina sp. Marseille-Q4063 TaxID=2810514 RepID=UPI001BAF7A68|nr:M15 family metallopeptidase [Sporosarcina sp. Marseille-Q4063]QUW23742.1 D-alanyl-D-alanine carboxypeptidase family protein [Sporosarcina sp. Marseille-Q4063]